MNQVDGVYSKQDYDKVERYLQMYYPQIALFWSLGVDTGYRVSDILRLKVSDITSGHISLVERKTGKQKDAPISNYTLTLALHYVAKNGLKNDCYIFWDGRFGKGVKPVTRQYVWKVIRNAGQAVGLPRLNLAHIPHARHTHGLFSQEVFHSTRHSEPLTTNSNPPRLGMSKVEWNNFLKSMMA
jgi:integrase